MKIRTWQIIVTLICQILGVLFHFTYEWSGENKFVAVFSATNESTFEHLKLTLFPMLLMAIIGYFVIGKRSKNYWFAEVIGILFAIFFIIVFFYTYTGVIGRNFAPIDIATFFVAVILGEYITYRLLITTKFYDMELGAIVLLGLLLFGFVLYTYIPPQIALFEDPTNNY